MESKQQEAQKMWKEGKKSECMRLLEQLSLEDITGTSGIAYAEKLVESGQYEKARYMLEKAEKAITE